MCDSSSSGDIISSARQSGVTSVLVDIVQTGNNFQCRSKMLIDPHPATMLEVGWLVDR